MAVWDGLQKAMGVGFNERLKPTQTDAASDLTSRGRVFNYTTSVKSSKLSSNPPSTSKCRSNPPSIKSSSLQRSPATQVNTPGPSTSQRKPPGPFKLAKSSQAKVPRKSPSANKLPLPSQIPSPQEEVPQSKVKEILRSF